MKWLSNLFGSRSRSEPEPDVIGPNGTFERASSTIFFLASDYDSSATPFIVDLPMKEPRQVPALWYGETRHDAKDGSITVYEAHSGGRMGLRPAVAMALSSAAGVIIEVGSQGNEQNRVSAENSWVNYSLVSTVNMMANRAAQPGSKATKGEAAAKSSPTPVIAIARVADDEATDAQVEAWLDAAKLRKMLSSTATLHIVVQRSTDTPASVMATALAIIADHSDAQSPILDPLRTLGVQSKAQTDSARTVLQKVALSLAKSPVQTSPSAAPPVAA